MKLRSRFAPALILAAALGPIALAGPPQDAPEAAEEARDRKIMERFLAVLEKAPRRGTALDRVYGFHVERGSLDTFLKTYQTKVAADPADGASWLLIGLVEAQRGRDAAAVEAFRKAEANRPDDSMPAYYLGQALVLVGQPDAAADAFERALTRKPARADLLDLYQALGRVHQRAHRNDKALAVWDRLEKAFPDDPRVQEQIAHALADEAQDAPALVRFEALARTTRDRFRQVQFAIEAAELKVRLGKGTEALADFETLLGKLDPESWLYREVRRRVEDVFLRTDDLAGLASYYERWIKKTPDDVEAMARLGRTLASQGRVAEARKWLDEAVKLAPSRRELRTALIEQLVQDHKFAEAAAQYEALAKAEPNNPDVVRDWGRMLLRDTSRPEDQRKKAASEVWRRLAPDDTKDAVAVAQAADLFRQAGLTDGAIALYLRAIKMAPESSQYREYLGEYYHALKRPADALATWRATAEGPNRNAKTLGRLGEVLAGFGYRVEALEPLTEACRLEPEDFDLRLKLADLKMALDKPAEALPELEKAEKVASAEEQTEAVLERLIHAYQASGTLVAQIETLQKAMATTPTAAGWTRLARLLEAQSKPAEAARAIVEATRIDPSSVSAWVATARLREAAGDLLGSAEALRTLTKLDRRSRTDYLTGIAKLEARLGRRGPALEAGRELLAAAPGNPDHHQFFAELCFQLGEPDEGLDALRRAARANPSDPKAMLSLAENLARQFRTEEAIELYWRAFARTPDVEGKLSIVSRMADQYLQRNQLDRLIGRLERELREPNQQRELSLCLAQAHSASGDSATARLELERLLSTNARDVALLQQLSTLAQAEGDISSAAKYQKQIVDIAPSPEGAARLAELYVESGELSEAEAVWTRATAEGQEPERVLVAIDSLLAHGKAETVLAITERMLIKQPGDWEALYREGVALDTLKKPAEAARRFRAILDLKVGDDELCVASRPKKKGSTLGQTAKAQAPQIAGTPAPMPIENRISSVWSIREATKLEDDGSMSGGGVQAIWSPSDSGQARMAALGWLYALALREDKKDAFVKEIREACDKAGANPRPRWDLLYLQLVLNDGQATYEVARDLYRTLPADTPALFAYISAVGGRTETAQEGMIIRENDAEDRTPPLPGDEVDRVVAGYLELRKRRHGADASMLDVVVTELKRAKRPAEADRLYREVIDSADNEDTIETALWLTSEKGDMETLIRLIDKADRLRAGNASALPGVLSNDYFDSFARMMNSRAEAKAYPDVVRLLNLYFERVRRPEAVAQRARTRGAVPGRNQQYIQITLGKKTQNVTLDFLEPNVYFDLGSIQVLRQAFEIYRRDDLLSDLLAHFRDEARRLPEKDRVYPLLALAYVQWWDDDRDEAVRDLSRAVEAAKGDVDLRLGLAEILAKRGDPGEALELLDSVEPLDQKAMQRRELLALRLSVLAGDVERARKSSERLFGLRLDPNLQVQLAAQMNQLGMHDLAEAVLARARRHASGNTASLVSLMLQYQQQGNTETSFQVANQILRAGPNRNPQRNGNQDDSARREAIQVLARSGKIKDLIDRAETQLKTSPNSVQVLQTLADYYKADDQPEKVKATYGKLAEIRPDDAALRFQVANQLVQAGDAEAAIGHYQAAIKKDPALYARNYWNIQQAFQQVNKLEELGTMLDAIDLKAVGSNGWSFQQIVSTLLQEEKTRPLGLKLFRKAWKAFPDERLDLLSSVDNEEIWKLPEIYDNVREVVIPAAGKPLPSPWGAIDQVDSYDSDGKVTGIVTRLLEAAVKQNRLEILAKDVAEGLKRSPSWAGGRALQAMILVRQSKLEEARVALNQLIETEKMIPRDARMIVGQELDGIAPLGGIALKLYEGAIGTEDDNDNQFQYGPAKRLAVLYHQAGRDADARDLVLKYSMQPLESSGQPPGYTAYRLLNEQLAFGQQMIDLGYPVDAVHFYDMVLGDVDGLQSSRRWERIERLTQQATQGIEDAFKKMTPENLSKTLIALNRPPGPSPVKGKDKGPSVDLAMVVSPRPLDQAKVTSLLVETVRKAIEAKQTGAVDAMKAELARKAEAAPNDLVVATALAMMAIAEDDPAAIDRTTTKLVALVEKAPLDVIPEGTRPNARQRAEAARQIGLWPVARVILKRDPSRPAGALLEARAMEAARRQPDHRWTLAMLRERGQAALDRGDRVAAEASWRQMLRQVLAPPSSPKARKTKPAAAEEAPR